MKYHVLVLSTIIFFGCSDNKSSSTTKSLEKKWYQGGTLHRSNIGDWKTSTDENKLATCGDFMAKVDNTISMDELLKRAIELRACINEASTDLDSSSTEKVSEIAATCLILLRY